jgi:crotonobetainyl-CoA:carnitine CoA-transferase CaiB-like acyl-CoA transferase
MPIGLYQISGKAPSRLGNDHSSIAPYETLNARDGALMIAAGNPRLWQQLCAAIDAPELADDPRFRDNTLRVTHRPALKAALEARFAAFTVAALAERLEQFGVPCGRVRSVPDAFADPQVEPRQMLLSFDDPELTGFRVPGNPIKLSASPAQVFRRPPRLGEHNDELLR